MRAARLRHVGDSLEDVDYRTPRKLDKARFKQLATGQWIAKHRNLLITGPCGDGKTWLACWLAQSACPVHSPNSISPTLTDAFHGSFASRSRLTCSSSTTGDQTGSPPASAAI